MGSEESLEVKMWLQPENVTAANLWETSSAPGSHTQVYKTHDMKWK